MSSIYDWSLQAADNANADENINWLEGQLPSSVNNSARVMMQRMQEFLADIGGGLVATGTDETINITSHSPVYSYKNGVLIRFKATTTNAKATNLRLNNLAAKPIFKTGADKVIPLEGGEIQPDGIYACVYNEKLSDDGAWFLIGPIFTPPPKPQAQAVTAGFVLPFCGSEAPSGWLKCDGSWLSREEYADLFAVIGSQFGRDVEELTFRLPDLRGEFIRGWVDSRDDIEPQKERQFGSYENGMIESHQHSGATDVDGEHKHALELAFRPNTSNQDYYVSQLYSYGANFSYTQTDGAHSHKFTTDGGIDEEGRIGAETRPRNVALLYCIKY